MRVLLFPLSISLLLAPCTAALAAEVASVFGGRVDCEVVEPSGIQYCEGDVTTRVETWDGVPLDVSVTLPPADVEAPYPLILDLHGWSVGKNSEPSESRALKGYAVLSYSSRGFHESCGNEASRATDSSLSDPDACADRGWIRLADVRYEGRDSQYLAGLLVDEGLVIPDRIGATGASYGGGQSMVLAALKNRTMLPDGTLVPWESPEGTPLTLAAAAPLIPWSDLADSLSSNGATLDTRAANPYGSRAGVQKATWVAALLASAEEPGFFAPPEAGPTSDLLGWSERIGEGEPYDEDPLIKIILEQLTLYRSAYYMDDSVPPAPLFIYNAWTDDLFPATEGVRMWRKVSARHPGAEVALLFADGFGHPRAGLSGDFSTIVTRLEQFLDFHLLGVGDPVPPVEIYTQACGGSTLEGPFTAADWDALRPGEVRFKSKEAQRFDQEGGDLARARQLIPLFGGPCRTYDAFEDEGAASYLFSAVEGDPYTLAGSPTVIADLSVIGAEYAQVVARLWDVAPDGRTSLVTRGAYRPRADNLAQQVFQLPPNAWRFAAGHSPKLELLGQSAPNTQASSGPFSVTVKNLELRLPVLEEPGGGPVKAPRKPVAPPAESDAPQCPPLPSATCRLPIESGAAAIELRAGKKASDASLDWSWKRGEETSKQEFRAALAASGTSICVYDEDERLILSLQAPLSGECGSGECWSRRSSGAAFKDKKSARTGARKVTLRAGEDGKARIRAAGAGRKLGLPALPLEGDSLTVQLQDGSGECWGAHYPGFEKNDAKKLEATSE